MDQENLIEKLDADFADIRTTGLASFIKGREEKEKEKEEGRKQKVIYNHLIIIVGVLQIYQELFGLSSVLLIIMVLFIYLIRTILILQSEN